MDVGEKNPAQKATPAAAFLSPTPITLQPCANLAINAGHREIQERKETKTRTDRTIAQNILFHPSPPTHFKPTNNALLASHFSPFNPRLFPPPQPPCLPPQLPPDPEAPRVPTHAAATASSARHGRGDTPGSPSCSNRGWAPRTVYTAPPHEDVRFSAL
jgi:hypothetical protein